MNKNMFATCRSKTNPRTALLCMSILLLIVAFPIAGFSQDPATTGPSNIAYWNGGSGAWFGSGGTSNWVCEVAGSEYNCAPPNDASWTAIIGAAGPGLDGSVSVMMSTPATVGELLIGDGTNGNLAVTGPGLTLSASTIVVGVTHSGSTPNADTMTISNGAIVSDVNGYIGDHGTAGVKWSNGLVTVSGGGQWNNSGVLEVGRNGNGTLTINGGSVSALVGLVGVNGPSTGTVTLSGPGSAFTATVLDVGLAGTGILNVGTGTTVVAPQLTIGSTGTVNVVGMGGTLIGNVTNNGTLDPITTGNILGSYTAGTGGTTIFDITGKNSYGQLDVTGNVVLGGTLKLEFTNPYFRPVTGETFDFINVAGGSFTNAGYTVDLIGCKNCSFTEYFQNGELIVKSMNTPAEPETLVLLAISLIAVAVFVGRMRHSILPDLRI